MSREVVDNREKNRYEIFVAGELAGFSEYRRQADEVVFTHTEVGENFEGQGLASALTRGALDDVRARGLTAVPRCPYVKDWIDKHPEYKDLVAESTTRP